MGAEREEAGMERGSQGLGLSDAFSAFLPEVGVGRFIEGRKEISRCFGGVLGRVLLSRLRGLSCGR